jgi:Kae1-associated kinase Bud32
MRLIYRGAEANIYLGSYLGKPAIIKERISKRYRLPELDRELRETRTRREARVLYRVLRAGIPAPAVYDVDPVNCILILEYLEGEPLASYLDTHPEQARILGRETGEILARIHSLNIVHNDFTTANMLLKDSRIYVLDWGMTFDSSKIDDKAYDILVFKRSIKSRHYKIFEDLWQGFLEGYRIYAKANEVLAMAEKLEKMGRYWIRE